MPGYARHIMPGRSDATCAASCGPIWTRNLDCQVSAVAVICSSGGGQDGQKPQRRRGPASIDRCVRRANHTAKLQRLRADYIASVGSAGTWTINVYASGLTPGGVSSSVGRCQLIAPTTTNARRVLWSRTDIHIFHLFLSTGAEFWAHAWGHFGVQQPGTTT